jgi:hypothetical protein
MSMIFSGMDPYLEDSLIWRAVHNRMAVYLADAIQALVGERYVTSVEERVYVEGPGREMEPDVWVRRTGTEPLEPGVIGRSAMAVLEQKVPILVKVPSLEAHETYITILDRLSGQKIVTVIELVSPSNKYAGPGRRSYVTKQTEVLESDAHLVEIDLHRYGPHVLAVPEHVARGKAGGYDYLACVNRAKGSRDEFELYPSRLREPLPPLFIPLSDTDADVRLDLQAVLNQTYDAARLRLRVDYGKPCMPPLSPDDQVWADALIRQAGLTSSV